MCNKCNCRCKNSSGVKHCGNPNMNSKKCSIDYSDGYGNDYSNEYSNLSDRDPSNNRSKNNSNNNYSVANYYYEDPSNNYENNHYVRNNHHKKVNHYYVKDHYYVNDYYYTQNVYHYDVEFAKDSCDLGIETIQDPNNNCKKPSQVTSCNYKKCNKQEFEKSFKCKNKKNCGCR